MSEPNQTQAQAAATNGASSAGFVRWLRARLAGSGANRRPLRVRLKEWFGLGRLIGFGLLLLLFVLRAWDPGPIESLRLTSPLKKASLTGFHATAKHIAAKAVSPSSETMRTI